MSAESGIPTFRGKDGLWSKFDPEKVASLAEFHRNPSLYWEFTRWRNELILKAKPNPGHSALAELERRGKMAAVITQNVDGLHQEAGSRKVIELHGTARKARCLSCREEFPMEEIQKRLHEELPPRCERCGGLLKPATVLFGESLPQEALEEAMKLSRESDLFLALGSSLVVYPAAHLPLLAKESGARLVIINLDPTPLDSKADVVIYGKTGEILPQILRELEELESEMR